MFGQIGDNGGFGLFMLIIFSVPVVAAGGTTTIVDGRGFTAVMVSWMAKFNPVIMIFVSLLLVVLSRGASEISTAFGLNRSFSDILTGIILFFIIGCEFFINYKVQFRSSGKKDSQSALYIYVKFYYIFTITTQT